MARFWGFITFAATVLLSGLASMTEDTIPLLSSLTVPLSPVAAATTRPATSETTSAEDAAERRSYQRRHQRSQSADDTAPAGRTQGVPKAIEDHAKSEVLANLISTHPPDAMPTTPTALGPVVPVPLPLETAAYAPAGISSPKAAETGKYRRKPVPRRANARSPRSSHAITTTASPAPMPDASAAVVAPAATDPASGSLGRIPRAPSGDARAHEHHRNTRRAPAPRKQQALRHHTTWLGYAAAQRRATRRHARNDALWPRVLRDGS